MSVSQNPPKRKSTRRFKYILQLLNHKFPVIFYGIRWLLICLVLSTCVGSASALLLNSLEFVTNYRETHLWVIFFLPLAGLLIGLLYHYYGGDANDGNNLLIDAIHKSERRIPFRMAPLVFLGTVATHLFGGSAGREGTALQMAGAIADVFCKPFRLSGKDRSIMLIAATSAGFGSVFGTPLAGAVFGLEFYLIGKIRYHALFPAFVASVLADWVTKAWNIHHTPYSIPFVPDISPLNILYSVLAGLAFGLCAILFSKSMHGLTGVFKSKIAYPPFRSLVGGALVVCCIWLLGTTDYIGLGIPMIEKSFTTQLPEDAFLLKLVLTVLTLSAGFKGGEVTPLFFIGATLGNLLSLFIPLPMGLLAGIGFVAVFAGATNTPIACTLMAIELFGESCGVYAAIACVTAYMVSGHTGIYARQVVGDPKFKEYADEEGRHISEIKR